MYKQIFILAIAALLMPFAIPSYAITPDTSHHELTTSRQTNVATENQMVALLKEQLQSERQNNEKILQTVYWALGVITTLTFALLGFGWFANFRMYERDKISLMQILETELINRQTAANKELSAAIHNQFESLQKEISATTGIQNDRIAKLQESIVATTDKAINSKVAPLEHNLQSLSSLAQQINMDLKEHQARNCFDTGQFSPGVHFINEAIQIALAAKKPWHIQYHLQRLEEQLAKGGAIQPGVLIDIVKTVESLKDEVTQTQKENVLQFLKKYSPVPRVSN